MKDISAITTCSVLLATRNVAISVLVCTFVWFGASGLFDLTEIEPPFVGTTPFWMILAGVLMIAGCTHFIITTIRKLFAPEHSPFFFAMFNTLTSMTGVLAIIMMSLSLGIGVASLIVEFEQETVKKAIHTLWFGVANLIVFVFLVFTRQLTSFMFNEPFPPYGFADAATLHHARRCRNGRWKPHP